jgi:hypothetical protein
MAQALKCADCGKPIVPYEEHHCGGVKSRMRPATVPICDACWRIEEGDREPVRLREPDTETCHYCEQETRSGIYVRRMIKP